MNGLILNVRLRRDSLNIPGTDVSNWEVWLWEHSGRSGGGQSKEKSVHILAIHAIKRNCGR